jgi:shikimate dehydrogenase
MQLLAALGVAGASVTMPHKSNAFRWIDEQRGVLDSSAQDVGAVNTLYFDGIQWRGENSDILGIQRPLAQALASISAQGPHRVLVLGSGSAAAAALRACESLQLETVLCARHPEAARARFPHVPCEAWEKRCFVQADVLINASAISGRLSPWRSERPLRKALVFDLAMGPQPSALLRQANAEGVPALGPMAMWCAQGAAQMRRLLSDGQLWPTQTGAPPLGFDGEEQEDWRHRIRSLEGTDLSTAAIPSECREDACPSLTFGECRAETLEALLAD